MKTILRSEELTCPSCVLKTESALKTVPGVREAKVRFATGRIEHDRGALFTLSSFQTGETRAAGRRRARARPPSPLQPPRAWLPGATG
jgi:copper chaperone CopZ